MKIEKINDNQIKFLLSNEDLRDRNIRLDELAYGSEKAQELFREIMERAGNECNFHAGSDTPLVIEAIPMNRDGIMIIVTKVASPESLGERFGLDGFLNHSHIPQTFGDTLRAISGGASSAPPANTPSKKHPKPKKDRDATPAKQSIFAFNSFDQVVAASIRLSGSIRHNSVLYKHRQMYYLMLENTRTGVSSSHEGILCEYGTKLSSPETSREISKMFLAEHGEVIIKRNAISILAAYLS